MMLRPSPRERRLALATGQADLDAKTQQSDLAQQKAAFSQLSQLYGLDERSQKLPLELDAQQAATDATIGASSRAEAMAPAQLKAAQLANYNTEAMAPVNLGLGKAQIGLAGSQAAGLDAETASRQQEIQSNAPAARVALEDAQARNLDMTSKLAPLHYATDLATHLPPEATPDYLNEALMSYMPPEIQANAKREKQKKAHGVQRQRDMQMQSLVNAPEILPGDGAAFGLTDEQLSRLIGKPLTKRAHPKPAVENSPVWNAIHIPG